MCDSDNQEKKDVHVSSCFRGILDSSVISWMYLPPDLLLEIFQLLNYKDLASVGQVCHRWKDLADKEFLWEIRLKTDFKVNKKTTLCSDSRSWKEEYERLVDRVPSVELDKIEEHSDEVLHVSFSNNGMMFSTCSKDAFVKVYNADWPFDTVFSSHLGESNSLFRWKYTQLSQFSPCDTQLLVSGRCAGSEQGGEIVIFNIYAGSFSIQSRVRIWPYDVMGTWLNDTHILSARAHFASYSLQCLCEVILNKSAQEVEDCHQSTATRSFLFKCENLATVSYLHVADITKPLRQVVKYNSSDDLDKALHPIHIQYLQKLSQNQQPCQQAHNSSDKVCEACSFTSHRCEKRMKMTTPNKLKPVGSCFNFCSKSSKYELNHSSVDDRDPNLLLQSCGIKGTDTESITDPGNMRETPVAGNSSESNTMRSPKAKQHSIDGQPSQQCRMCHKLLQKDAPQRVDDVATANEVDSSSATSADEDFNHMELPKCYKLFLCFTGSLVCVPHQIGIKILEQEECSKVEDRYIKKILNSLDHNRPELDAWDHVIELQGQCVGMTLSPCNRYVYVNVRRWLRKWDQDNRPERPPAISSAIELLVYDLITMQQVATLGGHKADSDVFFLHLTSNHHYVASGSEDNRGYIWDRHYKTCVSSLPHDDVVNCIAVNPRDPSMAVSVSDDKSVKIWRSRAFHRLFNGARPKARTKFRLHVGNHPYRHNSPC